MIALKRGADGESRNVDRLFAMWQAVYADTYFLTAQVDAAGTYTNAPGASEDVTSRKNIISNPKMFLILMI